jgi:alanine racemase
VTRSPKSYNSQVGVALSVTLLNDYTDIGVFEAGISERMEMQSLEKILRPQYGIITNIGIAHQENFSSYDEKLKEKLKLFTHSDAIFYCSDHMLIHDCILNDPAFASKKLITWGRNKNSDLKIQSFEKHEDHTLINCFYGEEIICLEIPFTDQASIENALFVYLVARYMSISPEHAVNYLARLEPVAMRMEVLNGINNMTIVNDTYNSDPGAIEIAFDFLWQQKQHQKRSVILSDVLQTGYDSEYLYKNLAERANNYDLNYFIGIGKEIRIAGKYLKCKSQFFDSTEDFLTVFNRSNLEDEVVLIKGARKFTFEKIVHALEEKLHRTVLEVNLDALLRNYNYFRSLLKKDTRLLVMVKAFGYGSGSVEVAQALQHAGVDYLGVAFADEGIQLRKAGVEVPVLVLNPTLHTLDQLIRYNLEPEVYSLKMLKSLLNELKHKNIFNFPVHLKIETGMNRQGIVYEDLKKLKNLLKNNSSIEVRSIFSHLAATDETEHDAFTIEQIRSFENMTVELTQALPGKPMKHILNSAGIQRFNQYQFDMVRLGIGLYGISAIPEKELDPVSTFKSYISQIKRVKKGETVGYSRKGKVDSDRKIGIVPVGYADGFDRKLSNGYGRVFVNGKYAPVIGNVCMDMCMIDLKGIEADINDEVEIFGPNISISELADKLNTIPYEIFTRVADRVKRIYTKD